MHQFDFRIGFQLPGSDHINCDDSELEIASDANGATLRLRSGAAETPIKAHPRAALIGGPYASEAAAADAAARAKRALLTWAVRNRTGLDFGGRRPRGGLTQYGERWIEGQLGRPVRHAKEGVDVFEHVDGLVFVSLNGELSVGRGQAIFVEQVGGAFAVDEQLTDREELAAELFSASWFDASERSRFITRITAVEALIDCQPRPPAAQEVVAALQQTIRSAGLDGATTSAMLGSVHWMKSESIGQAGRALVGRLLPGDHYSGVSASRFFSRCYNLRSSILHRGGVVVEDGEQLSVILSEASRFVGDLLLASMAMGRRASPPSTGAVSSSAVPGSGS